MDIVLQLQRADNLQDRSNRGGTATTSSFRYGCNETAWCQRLVINFLVNESNVTNVNEIFFICSYLSNNHVLVCKASDHIHWKTEKGKWKVEGYATVFILPNLPLGTLIFFMRDFTIYGSKIKQFNFNWAIFLTLVPRAFFVGNSGLRISAENHRSSVLKTDPSSSRANKRTRHPGGFYLSITTMKLKTWRIMSDT